MTPQDPLADLRDIHLPAEIDWWPPAPGWWILAAMMLAGSAVLITAFIRYRRRLAPRRTALKLLDAYYAEYEKERDTLLFCQRAQNLLRRTALHTYGTDTVAALNGRHWLNFLDAQTDDRYNFATMGEGFLAALYQPDAVSVDSGMLYSTTQYWLRTHRRQS